MVSGPLRAGVRPESRRRGRSSRNGGRPFGALERFALCPLRGGDGAPRDVRFPGCRGVEPPAHHSGRIPDAGERRSFGRAEPGPRLGVDPVGPGAGLRNGDLECVDERSFPQSTASEKQERDALDDSGRGRRAGPKRSCFLSDIFLGAPPGAPDSGIPVDLTYRPRDGGPPVTVTTPILPGTTRVLSDVLRGTFPASAPGSGALEIRSPVGLQVLAVTRSDSEAGPASQDVVSIREGDEITNVSPAAFVGVAEFEEARSNLVLVNEGPSTTVDLRMFSEARSPWRTRFGRSRSGRDRAAQFVRAAFRARSPDAREVRDAPRHSRARGKGRRVGHPYRQPDERSRRARPRPDSEGGDGSVASGYGTRS